MPTPGRRASPPAGLAAQLDDKSAAPRPASGNPSAPKTVGFGSPPGDRARPANPRKFRRCDRRVRSPAARKKAKVGVVVDQVDQSHIKMLPTSAAPYSRPGLGRSGGALKFASAQQTESCTTMESLFGSILLPHVHCYLGKASLIATMVVDDTRSGGLRRDLDLSVGLIAKTRVPTASWSSASGVFIGACGATISWKSGTSGTPITGRRRRSKWSPRRLRSARHLSLPPAPRDFGPGRGRRGCRISAISTRGRPRASSSRVSSSAPRRCARTSCAQGERGQISHDRRRHAADDLVDDTGRAPRLLQRTLVRIHGVHERFGVQRWSQLFHPDDADRVLERGANV